jgi:hypothetical protein
LTLRKRIITSPAPVCAVLIRFLDQVISEALPDRAMELLV